MSMLDEEAVRGWAAARREDPEPTVAFFTRLLQDYPGDPQALFHAARAFDYAGRPGQAAALYEQAFDAGLAGRDRMRALTSYGSTLRNLGRVGEAVAVLECAAGQYPDEATVAVYLALALTTGGRPEEAVALLVDLAVERVDDEELSRYRWALGNYTAALRRGFWSADGGSRQAGAGHEHGPWCPAALRPPVGPAAAAGGSQPGR